MALDKLFSKFLDSPSSKGALGGAASGAVVSLLMNKKARKKLGSGALKVGGMAALAGVGYVAYKKWQAGQTNQAVGPASSSSASNSASLPEPNPPVDDALGLKMIQAMVAAANADGSIDNTEMEALLNAVEQAGLTPEENAAVTAALNRPPSLEDIAASASSPEEAAEIYGAALCAIEVDTPAEHFFLRRLAQALQLDPQLTEMIQQQA